MRISPTSHFPHPILSSETSDYTDKKFEVEISVDEDPVTNALKLECDVILEEENIENLLQEGSVKIAIDIHCRDTYQSSLHNLGIGKNNVSFGPGSLSGRVTIRPLIFTTKAIEGFYSDNFDDEYQDQAFNLELGDIVAWDVEHAVQVGQKKLAPMDSIFELARNDDVPEGEFRVNIENDKIQVNASGTTYDHIHLQRGTGLGQVVLLNSVYFPAVLQVLAYLKEGGTGDYANLEWFQVFRAKCDFYSLDLNSSDVLQNANQLLKNPYTKIMGTFNNE